MDGKSLLLAAIVFVALLNEIRGHRPPCGGNDFRCFNGNCIPWNYFCDGKFNCDDKSDEQFCNDQIGASLTMADDTLFVHMSLCPSPLLTLGLKFLNPHTFYVARKEFEHQYCAGKGVCEVELCSNLADLEPYERCPSEGRGWFRCRSGIRCIPNEWHCDGHAECSDESDEMDCDESISTIRGVDATIYNMTGSLKAARDNSRSIAKWGPELPRIAVSLFLSDPQVFAPGNATGAELAYELSLQMMAKLALKRKIATQELALFINALSVSCIDPKDFFGVNLVAELRKRVNNSNYTNPFTYLTLCNAGDSMTTTDVTNVASTFEARRRPLWTDVQALATMAMACMNSRVDSVVEDDILTNMVKELKTKQHTNGTVGNVRTTALVMQALIATNSYLVDFDFAGAVKYLVQEAADSALSIQDMYYILPVLKSVSFVNVSSSHCSTPIKTELEVLKNSQESMEERISVRISMFLRNDVDFVRTWQLKVPATYNFYQVLENIGTLEPPYKVRYSTGQGKKPYIEGIHEYFDDAENEIFWFIYSQKLGNATSRTLVEKSPVDIQLKEDEELILWYRSGVWVDSP